LFKFVIIYKTENIFKTENISKHQNQNIMKRLLFVLSLTFCSAVVFGQSCVTCDENTINFENGASAIGTQNISSGVNAFATGYINEATGNYSIAGGYGSKALGNESIALGKNAKASGIQSFALGLLSEAAGSASLAIGAYARTSENAILSIALGSKVISVAERSMTIGYGLYDTPIENNISNSLMIGFNSDRPTLFLGASSGIGKTGSIAIGNITAPVAKLHILGDNDASQPDNASLYIQSAGEYYSTLWLGDQNHYIKTKPNANLLFNAANENFIFESGNLGVGTNEPEAKIQVKDGDIFIEDVNRGIIMKSPDGNCWRGTVNNQGMMEFAPIDCNTLQAGTSVAASDPASAIKIYPNPAGNQIFISCNANFDALQLEITNLSGRLISTQKLSNSESFIDLSAYRPGTYIFRLTDESGKQVATQKVIKE
jgi:hypothetical protein